MSSVLIELEALAWSRPGLHASAAEIADWYQRKAQMLDHLAEQSHGADAERAADWAQAAHRHANRLLADPQHERTEVAA